MSYSHTKILATATLAAALTLCGTTVRAQSVYTDFDHNANFSQYHTFSLYKVHAGDPLVESRLRADIEQSLQQRGWQEVPQNGDVAVTAIGNVREQQEYSTFYDGLGGGGFGYGGWGGRFGYGGWGGRSGFGGGGTGVANTQEYQIPVGTLAVDLYDSHAHQLVFRGTATEQLSTKADKNDKKATKAVDKIFDKIPGRQAS